MAEQVFRLNGRVINRATRRGEAGLRVEAWDKDTKYHDLLGVAHTDINGRFQIDFTENYFGDAAPDRLPDVFFKIFYDTQLLESTEEQPRWNLAAGEHAVEFEVDVPQRDLAAETLPQASTEIGIHELGESIAVTVASVQRELSRYPSAFGSYVLDELDLSIPVRMRVDELGQVMATVTETQAPDTAVGQLRLRLKPVPGLAEPPPPVTSDQTLESLGLSPEVIERLAAVRVFSVNDLLRVGHSAAGRAALSGFDLGVPWETVKDRVGVLLLPVVPPQVSEKLLQAGIEKPADFLTADPDELAASLSGQLNWRVTPEHVASWQQAFSKQLAAPLQPPARFSK